MEKRGFGMGLSDNIGGQLIKAVELSGSLLEGHFKLSSGLHSNFYLQCSRIFLDPALAHSLLLCAVDLIYKNCPQDSFSLVVSPALGGVLVGYELARVLRLKSVFFERVNKNFVLRRGFEVQKQQGVIIAEDVISTGKSVVEIISELNKFKAEVKAIFCIVNRSGKDFLSFDGQDFPIISLGCLKAEFYEEDALPAYLQKLPISVPGSRFLNQ